MANPNSCTSTVACATGGSAAVTGHEAMAAFAQAQRALVRARRTQTATFGSLFLLAVAGSLWVSEVSVSKVVTGLPGLVAYVAGTLPMIRLESVSADVAEWYWGLGRWLTLLLDTLVIAFMGTLLGATGAFVLGFPAAHNLASHTGMYSLARRCLEIARTVPELVYALMFVYAFGLGPLPGVLAIAVHSLGSLGKLFSEVAENIDSGPVEGVRAAGANWWQTVRYAVVPQVLPNFASYTLLRFEINVRASSVVGFVGAGGIGQELYTVIRQFIYVDISAIVLLLIVTVAILDILCEQLRQHLIGAQAWP
jgi:phosphonate transport system permease protein